MYILIIEDNIRIADNITFMLKKENYQVDCENNGEDGYRKALQNSYDLLILDLMLPGMSGFEILESLRANDIKIPVLILSAKGQVEDKVRALDLGGDDYLTKPFAPAELLARVRSILRRKFDVSSSLITIGDLVVDTNKKELIIKDEIISLTGKEYEVLEFLAYSNNRVISRIAIGEHIWGETLDLFTMSNFIDVHIKNLRKKIETATGKKYIYTKRGVGFILTEKETS